CPECGRGLSSRAALEAHRRIHSGERPYECPDCGKGFTAVKSLSKHRKTHRDKSGGDGGAHRDKNGGDGGAAAPGA
ncbi:ZSC20 protein, partial [Copsychus sechellarum]|nr:ZSC20 protein [Copsychus sechellarum]